MGLHDSAELLWVIYYSLHRLQARDNNEILMNDDYVLNEREEKRECTSRWWGCPVPAAITQKHTSVTLFQREPCCSLLWAQLLHNCLFILCLPEKRKPFTVAIWFSISAKCWLTEFTRVFSEAPSFVCSYFGTISGIRAADQTFSCPCLCHPPPPHPLHVCPVCVM